MKPHINATDKGFIVYAPIDVGDMWRYYPIINFGDRQSDAKDFISDMETMSDVMIKNRAKGFDINTKYKRLGKLNYRKNNE